MNMMILLLILHLAGSVQGRYDGPGVPEGPCITQMDCVDMGWVEPLPGCENLTCTCPPNTCPVYTSSSGVFEYQYFCGPCRMLGAACTNNTDCVVDWQCKNNFCECDGFVELGVCVYYEAVPTSTSTVVLIFILIFIVIIQQVISSRKTLRKLFCRSSSESEDEVSRVVASNPRSNDKTAAFTIAHADFMATNEDPDLAWALELSLRNTEANASTWPTTSSFPPPDPRFVRSRPPDQPGPSEWRHSPDEARPQRRCSRSSHSVGHSDTVSSCSSSIPSASLRNTYSFTNSSRPSSLAFSDDMSLHTLESLRMECDVNDLQSTRV